MQAVATSLLASFSALAGLACAPSDDLFGNVSSAGGGASVSTGGGAPGDGGATAQSSGGGLGGDGESGQGGDATNGSNGGGGSQTECDDPGDCDDPEGECTVAACVQGFCGEAFVPEGTPTVEQDIGDCKTIVCDGSGGTVSAADDGDLVDHGNDCILETCGDGELVVVNADPGTACGDGNLACNGSGECAGCNNPDPCPGKDEACQARTCDDGVCGFQFEDEGTLVEDETGNCIVKQCDGEGHVESIVEDGDLPEDGNECTRDVCSDGEPDNPPRDEGASCSGGSCDGDGNCVGCVDDSDCGADTACATFVCDNENTCDVLYGEPGDFAGDPVPDDCLHDECGSQGVIVEDVPDDVGDFCGGGQVCDGDGNCGECGSDDDCTSAMCRCGACLDYAELFFSQYVEGSGNNKALEIYNPRNAAVDLADLGCEIHRFNNEPVPTMLALTGTIQPGQTYVVCNTLATFAGGCDQVASVAMDFNGDDTVALACDFDYLDAIGEVFVDPGTEWGSGNASTADNTLTRRPGIFFGRDPFDEFVPSDEFIGSDADDIAGLGEHDACGG